MTAWRLLPLLLLLAACAFNRPAPDTATPPDDGERMVRLAEARAGAGAHAEAVGLFEEVVQIPSAAYADRALLGLTRTLCNPEYADHDYRRAYIMAVRLVRDYPDSRHAAEGRAWRDLLFTYLDRGEELDRRAAQLKEITLELVRQERELQRLQRIDLELARRSGELQLRTQELQLRTQELQLRTQELERLKRVDIELARRTRELERLKRLDLELEQQRRKP